METTLVLLQQKFTRALQEDKITQVVEALSDDKRFETYVNQWVEDEENSNQA